MSFKMEVEVIGGALYITVGRFHFGGGKDATFSTTDRFLAYRKEADTQRMSRILFIGSFTLFWEAENNPTFRKVVS